MRKSLIFLICLFILIASVAVTYAVVVKHEQTGDLIGSKMIWLEGPK